MCTARVPNSHLAAANSSSLRQPCRNELCVLPVLSTVTEVSLSHWITIRNPRHSFPHTLATTITVSNSRVCILKLLLATFSGNSAWKYSCWEWSHAPQPCRQATVATTSSGAFHFCHASLTPHCIGEETPHHNRSLLMLSGTLTFPTLGRPHRKTPVPSTWAIVLV